MPEKVEILKMLLTVMNAKLYLYHQHFANNVDSLTLKGSVSILNTAISNIKRFIVV